MWLENTFIFRLLGGTTYREQVSLKKKYPYNHPPAQIEIYQRKRQNQPSQCSLSSLIAQQICELRDLSFSTVLSLNLSSSTF